MRSGSTPAGRGVSLLATGGVEDKAFDGNGDPFGMFLRRAGTRTPASLVVLGLGLAPARRRMTVR